METHWRITVVDGGNFRTYNMEFSTDKSSRYIPEIAGERVSDNMCLNSLHEMNLRRIHERTMKDYEVVEEKPTVVCINAASSGGLLQEHKEYVIARGNGMNIQLQGVDGVWHAHRFDLKAHG